MLVGYFIVLSFCFHLSFFCQKKKIIYISHSIESEIRKKNIQIYLFTTLLYFLKNLFFKFSDISTSVSKKEQKIKSYYNKKTILLPNGIEIKNLKKIKKISTDYLIYTGSYLYKSNKDAIDFLNDQIMPKLILKYPKLKLVITGGGYKEKNFRG